MPAPGALMSIARGGIRLFTLAIGSWLYRMCCGFWTLFTGNIGRTDDFSGWFDYIIDLAFFIPSLIVAEMFIRARRARATAAGRIGATAALAGSAVFGRWRHSFSPPTGADRP